MAVTVKDIYKSRKINLPAFCIAQINLLNMKRFQFHSLVLAGLLFTASCTAADKISFARYFSQSSSCTT
ncbi:hypothetical protein CS542_02600 [Pedobacter sp. IW39]|nr:hypothetical protein CS542_02600 [Pedobacter sp. IW39]